MNEDRLPPPPTPDERWNIAYYEAGRAVLLGQGALGSRAFKRWRDGATEFGDNFVGPPPRNDLAYLVLAAIAGRYSMRLAAVPNEALKIVADRMIRDDREIDLRLTTWHGVHQNQSSWTRGLGGMAPNIKDFIKKVQSVALTSMEDHFQHQAVQQATQAFATSFLEADELSHEQIRAIFAKASAAAGGLPEPLHLNRLFTLFDTGRL